MLANSSAEEKHGNDRKYLFISVQTSFLLSWSSEYTATSMNQFQTSKNLNVLRSGLPHNDGTRGAILVFKFSITDRNAFLLATYSISIENKTSVLDGVSPFLSLNKDNRG